jgi:RNA polymerase sigma-70 factor (ECF subfamily)
MQANPGTKTFLERIETHQDIVHKVSFIYSRVPADREDLRQEILLQLWKSRDSFTERSAFSTWMYRVALNTAITFRRKQKPAPEIVDEPWDYGTQQEDAELSHGLQVLYRAIARLSAVEKAIIMQWLDERSYEDIANTMGMTVKNVSVRLVRIRTRLGKLIQEAEQP